MPSTSRSAAPSTNSMGIAADGVPVKIVLATQIAEAQIVVLDGSPIKAVGDLKGKKIGMSPPGSATHAIATAILDHNFSLKPNDYSVAPGNEAQLAQFSESEGNRRRRASLRDSRADRRDQTTALGKHRRRVEEAHQGKCPPILAVTIVYSDYLTKNPDAVAKFIAATRNALQYGSKNKPRVGEILAESREHECDRRARLRQPVGRRLHRQLRTG